MAINLTKSSGERQGFDIGKLIDSLVRSGAPADVAADIARRVERQLPPSAHTKAVFRLARRLLRQYSHASGMKYSLKKAIFSLGPAGYRFEKYFGRVLRAYGYSVEVDKIMEGYCVSHEVDIFASKGDEHTVIECKYHSSGGNATDVKVALYIHSRFNDIRKACAEDPTRLGAVHEGWLVTNTRCTSDAIRYAECAGLRIVSWKHPGRNSLERMIEDKLLYPVTVLPSAGLKSLDALFRNDIILAQEIADMDERTFLRRSGLDAGTAKRLKKQADTICPCTPEEEGH
jgi:hypothetical protein